MDLRVAWSGCSYMTCRRLPDLPMGTSQHKTQTLQKSLYNVQEHLKFLHDMQFPVKIMLLPSLKPEKRKQIKENCPVSWPPFPNDEFTSWGEGLFWGNGCQWHFWGHGVFCSLHQTCQCFGFMNSLKLIRHFSNPGNDFNASSLKYFKSQKSWMGDGPAMVQNPLLFSSAFYNGPFKKQDNFGLVSTPDPSTESVIASRKTSTNW